MNLVSIRSFIVFTKQIPALGVLERGKKREGRIENLDKLCRHVRLFNVGTRPSKTIIMVYRMMLALFAMVGSVASQVEKQVETKVDSDVPNKGGGGERVGIILDQLDNNT